MRDIAGKDRNKCYMLPKQFSPWRRSLLLRNFLCFKVRKALQVLDQTRTSPDIRVVALVPIDTTIVSHDPIQSTITVKLTSSCVPRFSDA